MRPRRPACPPPSTHPTAPYDSPLAVVKETLISIDDERRQLRYHLTEGPFPFSSYYSTMQVSLVSESGAAFVAWSSRYDCDEADAQANDELLAGHIYAPGLARIREMLERPTG